MIEDRFGARHRTHSAEAVAAFEAATREIAAHGSGAGEALGRALAADPHLVAAHALKGFANVLLAREELRPVAKRALADARLARLAKGAATPSERALTEALALATGGELLAAAGRLDAHLDAQPRDFLPAKLAHALRFMSGDLNGMLLGTARVLDAWSEDAPGYGFLLGCHAFALEEKGEFDAAERVGLRAVELEPSDAWGLHAVSHVHEMQGRTDEGIAWIEAKRPVWTACNNFSFHMAWHLALLHLERGDHARVLAIYDAEVRPASTDDVRDLANAVSLLWRLGQEGVDVGSRWEEARLIASRRQSDLTLTFASLHYCLALVGAGDRATAAQLAERLSTEAAAGPVRGPDQARVMGRVGADLARAILAVGGRSAPRPALTVLAGRVEELGGSHAQRDVFLRTLAGLAAEAGDRTALEGVLAVRARLKREDRFAREVRARLDAERPAWRLSA